MGDEQSVMERFVRMTLQKVPMTNLTAVPNECARRLIKGHNRSAKDRDFRNEQEAAECGDTAGVYPVNRGGPVRSPIHRR
jgi:hypothetical protein